MNATPPPSNATLPRADGRWRVAGWLLGGALFAAMLVYLIRALDAGDLRFDRVRGWPLALAFLLLLLAHGAQGAAWHALLRASGGTTSFRVDAGRWAVSILGKYLPGKVFNAVGRLLLYRDSALGIAGVAGAYVAEFMLSVTAAGCVAAIALAFAHEALPTPEFALVLLFALGGLVVTFSALFDRAAGWLAARLLRASSPLHIPSTARVTAFAWELAAYALMGCGLYALAAALQPAPWSLVPVFVGALCLSGIAGIFAFFVPAGLGVREGALVVILSIFVTPAFAALVAIASRIWLTAGEAIVVAIGAVLLRSEQEK